MKRCCFVLVIILYTIQLVGCDRQESAPTEDDVLELTIPISSSKAEEHDISETGYTPQTADLEAPYIPELGYHKSMRLNGWTDYVCWKDLLIIGDAVYRKENGVYERTGERPQDWFNTENHNLDSYELKQCDNLLIAQDQANGKIIVYDMDASRQISEYSFESLFWYVQKGKIYYRNDEGIFRMNPLSGDSELVYVCDSRGDLAIRDNGDILIIEGNRMVSDEMEFWLLSYDKQGHLGAKKIWEADKYGYIERAEFNNYGLFMLTEYNYDSGGEFLCLKDNGEVETVVMEKRSAWTSAIFTEEGYFLWDSQLLAEGERQEVLFSWEQFEKATTVVDSISYYDFQGNKLDTWRLIDDEMLELGYHLLQIVYGNGEIFAFYENEELDDLYISRVQVPLPETL